MDSAFRRLPKDEQAKRIELMVRRILELPAGRLHQIMVAIDEQGWPVLWAVEDRGKAEGLKARPEGDGGIEGKRQ